MKQKGLSREDAAELYRDLKRVMGQTAAPSPQANSKDGVAKQIAAAISAGMAKESVDGPKPSSRTTPARTAPSDPLNMHSSSPVPSSNDGLGVRRAILFLGFFAACKLGFSVLEATEVFSIQDAKASLAAALPLTPVTERFSPEELVVLKSLDQRRVELEQREQELADNEADLEMQKGQFAIRMTELRELSGRLRAEREKGEKKRDTQLDQLANVYGSMNPKEASVLIEQLDLPIALALLERMPEKRIGQILSLMTPEQALEITKHLSVQR